MFIYFDFGPPLQEMCFEYLFFYLVLVDVSAILSREVSVLDQSWMLAL